VRKFGGSVFASRGSADLPERGSVSADLEALHDPDPARVQDVHEVVVDGDARREVAAGRVDVGQPQLCSVDAEHRDGVAAGVDGKEQAVPLVVDERALGAQAVRRGAGRDIAAVATRRVCVFLRQASVAVAAEDDDLVAVELVGLDEHRALAAAVAAVGCRDGPCCD
jgi:hypothetical protein